MKDAAELVSASTAGSVDVEAASADSREAASILAALTHSITGSGPGGADTGIGVSTLLAQLAAQDAVHLRRMLPGVVAALRASEEASLLAGHAAARGQLRQILRVVAALAANPGLPIEASAGELLALTCSALLHRRSRHGPRYDGVGEKEKEGESGSSGSASGADATVQDDARLRAYAADVLSALVDRCAITWPEVVTQTGLVLSDALASALQPSAAASSSSSAAASTGAADEDSTSHAPAAKKAKTAARSKAAPAAEILDDGPSGGAAASSVTLLVTAPDTAFGALSGLVSLPALPVHLLQPLVATLAEQYATNADAVSASSAAAQSSKGASKAQRQREGEWHESWSALLRAQVTRLHSRLAESTGQVQQSDAPRIPDRSLMLDI